MNTSVNKKLDLLRKRREDSNIKKFRFSDIKKLKKRGYIFGIIIGSIGITICSFTSIHTYQRIKYKERLLQRKRILL